MMKLLQKNMLLLLLCTSLKFAYGSSIDVYPLEADLSSHTRFQDIKVYNVGDDTAYVQVNIERVENPGLSNQKILPLEDDPFQVGLIVTPDKMVIPKNEMRLARILYIGDPPTANDVVYKVLIAPVSGQLVALMSAGKAIDAGVEVIVSYGINVFIRPMVPAPSVAFTRNDKDLVIKNTGNTNVLLGDCQQCQVDGKTCTPIALNTRIYVGQSFDYHLPLALPVSCKQVYADSAIIIVKSR